MRTTLWISLIFLLIMVPLIAYSQSDGNLGNPTQTDYLGWIFVPLGALIGGFLGYLIKRTFVNQDVRFQERVSHEHWLLQQFNKLAEDYYFPLAKFSKDTYTSINRASISTDPKSIKIAYYHFGIFLKKYFDFKQSKGANFLFRDQKMEDAAIKKFGGLLIGVPFDDLELKDLNKEMFHSNGDFDDTCFTKRFFVIFENWIKTNHCNLSRSLVIEKLGNLSRILDRGSEDTSHPKSYEKTIKETPTDPLSADDDFWIMGLSKKSTRSGENLFVFGKGFTNQYIKFNFFLGDLRPHLQVINKTNSYIELHIPNDINDGIYDVHAIFHVERWYRLNEVTIGIPLRIVST